MLIKTKWCTIVLLVSKLFHILPCTWIHVKQNDILLEIRLKMSTIQVVINPSSSYRIQLIQLAISEFWVSVWARFLARSARAKLGSAQLTKLKIWKSSAQLSSPFERGQLSSARSLAKIFRLVPPLLKTYLTEFHVPHKITNFEKSLNFFTTIKMVDPFIGPDKFWNNPTIPKMSTVLKNEWKMLKDKLWLDNLLAFKLAIRPDLSPSKITL